MYRNSYLLDISGVATLGPGGHGPPSFRLGPGHAPLVFWRAHRRLFIGGSFKMMTSYAAPL